MYQYSIYIKYKLTSISRGFAAVLVRELRREMYYRIAGYVEFRRNRWVATYDLLDGNGPRVLCSYPTRQEAVDAIVREYEGLWRMKYQAEIDRHILREVEREVSVNAY